jgi:hypothetical protein
MDWLDTWNGYLPPTSNTTYTPNQFFDVVLPTSSRGVVRLVAYLIRKTLGWSDAYGRPQNSNIKISYRELERSAGIARSMLRLALDEAMAAHFIECVQEGSKDLMETPGTSALYKLKWDVRKEYITDPDDFAGFFAGNGNLTYIPNQFFDCTIPNESLAVIRVVGIIIRNTIGWQTEYGFRRQQVAMSFTELEARTGLSRQSINLALHSALAHRHLVRIEEGTFHADTTCQKTAVYGVKWVDLSVPITPVAQHPPQIETGPARKVDQEENGDRLEKLTREAARKVDQDRLEKLTRTGSKTLPGKRLEKLTSNKITLQEIKPLKITTENQQQQPAPVPPESNATAAAALLVEELVTQSLNRADAIRLAREKPEECRRQLAYLPFKIAELGGEHQFRSGKGAYLRRAIEQEFAAPKSYREVKARGDKTQEEADRARLRKEEKARLEALHPAYLEYLRSVEHDLSAQHSQVHHDLTQALDAERQKVIRTCKNPDSSMRKNWLLSLDGGPLWIDHMLAVCKHHGIPVLTFEEWVPLKIGDAERVGTPGNYTL